MRTTLYKCIEPIDLDKCNIGRKHLEVAGNPESIVAKNLIKEVILNIRTDPKNTLLKKYVCICKNSHCGEYDYQKKYISYLDDNTRYTTKFIIRRTRESVLNNTIIPYEATYFLECIRYFGFLYLNDMNLLDVMNEIDKLKNNINYYENEIKNTNVKYTNEVTYIDE